MVHNVVTTTKIKRLQTGKIFFICNH